MSMNSSLEYRPNFLKGLVGRIQFGKMNRTATGKEYEPSYRVANVARTGQNGLLYTDSISLTSPTTNVTNGNKLSEGSTVSSSYQLIATLSYAKKSAIMILT